MDHLLCYSVDTSCNATKQTKSNQQIIKKKLKKKKIIINKYDTEHV